MQIRLFWLHSISQVCDLLVKAEVHLKELSQDDAVVDLTGDELTRKDPSTEDYPLPVLSVSTSMKYKKGKSKAVGLSNTEGQGFLDWVLEHNMLFKMESLDYKESDTPER